MAKARITIINGEDTEGNSGCVIRFNPNRNDQKISIKEWMWNERSSDFVQNVSSSKAHSGSDVVINKALDDVKGMMEELGLEHSIDDVDIDNSQESDVNFYCELKTETRSFRIDGYHVNSQGTAFEDKSGHVENFHVMKGVKTR